MLHPAAYSDLDHGLDGLGHQPISVPSTNELVTGAKWCGDPLPAACLEIDGRNPQHRKTMRPDSRNENSHHILVVEDHPGVLNATLLLLRSAGYQVTTATSLTEAIERSRDSPDLDLVITDYHLAHGDTGKQVVSSMRELRGSDFKAIVITGDTASAVHRFDGDGALCWMTKPVDPEQLLGLLKRLLARRPNAH